MSQELLHLTQIRSPVKHMRGGTVPQSMRANVGNAGITRACVHHTTYHPLINAFALSPKKQRSRGLLTHQQGTPIIQPPTYRLLRRSAKWHDSLFVAFAGHFDRSIGKDHIRHIESHQFSHTHARRIQQFQHGGVTQLNGLMLHGPFLRLRRFTVLIHAFHQLFSL